MVNAGALLVLVRPIDAVHNDSKTQETKKTIANQAVNFLRTSAVDVPKSESEASPPNEAPRPVLLLSWIRIMKQRMAQRSINREIAVK